MLKKKSLNVFFKSCILLSLYACCVLFTARWQFIDNDYMCRQHTDIHNGRTQEEHKALRSAGLAIWLSQRLSVDTEMCCFYLGTSLQPLFCVCVNVCLAKFSITQPGFGLCALLPGLNPECMLRELLSVVLVVCMKIRA